MMWRNTLTGLFISVMVVLRRKKLDGDGDVVVARPDAK
jgi:hypothetical protein